VRLKITSPGTKPSNWSEISFLFSIICFPKWLNTIIFFQSLTLCTPSLASPLLKRTWHIDLWPVHILPCSCSESSSTASALKYCICLLNVRNVHCLIGYNRPTLCIDYYFFIYYSGSYMFRHLRAIFRERPLFLWFTWKSEMVVLWSCTVNTGGLCAPDVVVSCITVSSWAHTAHLDKVPHQTTTSGAHQHLQYCGTSRWHNHFGLSSNSQG
jgi:hypothetical protein